MSVIYEGPLHIDWGMAWIATDHDDPPERHGAFRGQQNGLCGAAKAGRLLLQTGLLAGFVGFHLEVSDSSPVLDDSWEEIVEVSFRAPASEIGELGLQSWDCAPLCHVPLSPAQSYRARYCARNMDHGHQASVVSHDEPIVDSYFLVFWLAPPSADAVLKQTSETAAYWHEEAHKLPLSAP